MTKSGPQTGSSLSPSIICGMHKSNIRENSGSIDHTDSRHRPEGPPSACEQLLVSHTAITIDHVTRGSSFTRKPLQPRKSPSSTIGQRHRATIDLQCKLQNNQDGEDNEPMRSFQPKDLDKLDTLKSSLSQPSTPLDTKRLVYSSQDNTQMR